MTDTTYALTIRCEGAAFDENMDEEVQRLLRLAADRIEIGVFTGSLRDSNGNTVGSHQLTELPEL